MSKKHTQKNNPVIDGLMRHRTVVLSGPITYDLTGEVGPRLYKLQLQSSDPINLVIDSRGGSSEAVTQLCDVIAHELIAPVRGIVVGACGSAATFLLLHCGERLTTPHSRFLVHSGSFGDIKFPLDGKISRTAKQLERDAKTRRRKVLDLYADLLTPPAWEKERPSSAQRRKYVKKLMKRGDQLFGNWMTAKDALRAGLVTEIVRGKLSIFSD